MRTRFRRPSSFLVVTALGVVIPVVVALGACSSFDAVATDADGGTLLDAGPEGSPPQEAATVDAALDGDAACRDVLGHDFIAGAWTLGGTAVSAGNFVVVLTKASASQRGLAWHAVDLAPMRSFRASFTLRVTTADAPPSDGVAFFWSGDATPMPLQNASPPPSVPTVGGAPSSRVVVKHSTQTTCDDDGPVVLMPPLGSPTNLVTVSSAFEISLDGPTGTITVRRDGTTVIDKQRLGYVPGLIKSIGFTGATGNDYAKLEILDLAFTPCP